MMNIFTALFGKKAIDDDSVPYAYSKQYFNHIASSQSSRDLIRAMADYSGYVRQAAIGRAVALRHPDLLPAIAARLNDWVPQVRDAARSALITLLPMMPAEATLGILPAIVQLRHAGRHDHAAWLDAFERDLLKHLTPGIFVAALDAADAKVARASFALLHRHRVVDASVMLRAALASPRDIVTSLQAAAMIGGLAPEAQQSHYEAALKSSFGAVRTIGLRALLDGAASEDKRTIAMGCLLDPQSSVRGAAIAYLGANQVDVGAWYRQMLASAPVPVLRICLSSLGAMRQGDDAPVLKAFVTHPVIGVRAAAYAAWLKVAGAQKDIIAAQALADDAERIRKLALEMVNKQGAFIPFATVCALLVDRHDWRLLLRFARLEKWNRLEAIALIASSGDENALEMLKNELSAWIGIAGSYTRPTEAQVAFLLADQTLAMLGTLAGPGFDMRKIIEGEVSLVLRTRH